MEKVHNWCNNSKNGLTNGGVTESFDVWLIYQNFYKAGNLEMELKIGKINKERKKNPSKFKNV